MCKKDELAKKIEEYEDLERILLFEWHAKYLESWVNNFVSEKLSFDERGVNGEDFHIQSVTLSILRKFYSPRDYVRIDFVAKAVKNLYLGSDQEVLNFLWRTEEDLKWPFDQGGMSYFEWDEVGGASIIDPREQWKTMAYGLVMHADPKKGEVLRGQLGLVRDMAAFGPRPFHVVSNMLKIVSSLRLEKDASIPDPYETIWEA